MRLASLLLAGVAVLAAQKVPPPPPPSPVGPTVKGPPIPGDALGMSVQLAITGRILLEDRQAPPEPVPVDYSCRGSTGTGLTDSKGRFSIPVGRQQAARTSLANALPDLGGCRVQVRILGFEDVVFTFHQVHALSDLNVGDLILKSAGAQGNAVFSTTARDAPNKARGNYVRALQEIGANKYPEAVATLDKAVLLYPRYATALQLKGQLLESMGQREAARAAYRQAVAADPAYCKPLVQLAEMAAEDQDAAEAARWAAMVNRLVPGAYPSTYLIEGSAYFNLRRYEEAGKAAQAGIEADRTDFYPSLHRLLGEVLYQKRNYKEALEQFNRYLKDAPDAPDVEPIQERAESCKRLAQLTNK